MQMNILLCTSCLTLHSSKQQLDLMPFDHKLHHHLLLLYPQTNTRMTSTRSTARIPAPRIMNHSHHLPPPHQLLSEQGAQAHRASLPPTMLPAGV
mmetsp:Transcript_10291/g.28040  ORF Transcript_10291/g.28040 Transcript_10291/m.28040 type:complete len:95 (+) Transcript_10291:164-448(+)